MCDQERPILLGIFFGLKAYILSEFGLLKRTRSFSWITVKSIAQDGVFILLPFNRLTACFFALFPFDNNHRYSGLTANITASTKMKVTMAVNILVLINDTPVLFGTF